MSTPVCSPTNSDVKPVINPSDLELTFNDAVEQALKRASTTTSTPRGLSLLPVLTSPIVRARSDVERSIGKIDAGLRAKIRDLITGKEPWPLYLWGDSGLGKTSAALCVLDHCGKDAFISACSLEIREWMAGFIDVRTIAGVRINCDKGKLSWSGGDRTETASWSVLMKIVERHPVVVFDEIGVGREAADFRLDTLIEVLDRRANYPVKPFIVTGNVPPSQICEIYDDRVADRVLCGTVVKLEGDTRRKS